MFLSSPSYYLAIFRKFVFIARLKACFLASEGTEKSLGDILL